MTLFAPDPIFRDEFLLVAEKPAGLLAVPGRGEDKQDCLSSRVQAEFPDALVVHRLDMATSGLMVFARGVEMQRALSNMFRDRKVAKRYVAVVGGKFGGSIDGGSLSLTLKELLAIRLGRQTATAKSLVISRGERGLSVAVPGVEGWGEIDLPLICDWPNRPRQKVDHELGKRSLTRYRLLAYDESADASRVELEPVTGRTHQLRVHLAAIGHPIVGDALYGGREAARLMLHAASLSFEHPRLGSILRVESETPFWGGTGVKRV